MIYIIRINNEKYYNCNCIIYTYYIHIFVSVNGILGYNFTWRIVYIYIIYFIDIISIKNIK